MFVFFAIHFAVASSAERRDAKAHSETDGIRVGQRLCVLIGWFCWGLSVEVFLLLVVIWSCDVVLTCMRDVRKKTLSHGS